LSRLKVLHVTPSHFGDASVVGGAERYVLELARAMSLEVETTFVALAAAGLDERQGTLRVRHLPGRLLRDHPLARNPLSRDMLRAVRAADVIHAYQPHTFLTSAAIVAARSLRRPVFVTDLGGGHAYAPSSYLPILRWATAFLLISEYSRSLWRAAHRGRRPDRLDVIYAGVDTDRFRPADGGAPAGRRDEVLFVGRLLPHKGIEHLIDAIEPPLSLRIVGRPYDPPYLAMLRGRASGKPVHFESEVDDAGLVARYQRALALVLPSVSTDWRGQTTDVAELFGLVAVEAMACGRPAVVSRTGSLPELVEDGVTGAIVPAGDPGALRDALQQLWRDPARADAMGRQARAAVVERFTWTATARRCLQAYAAGSVRSA
jgi:glycosyltransferase involved in cell wall biosynthesis